MCCHSVGFGTVSWKTADSAIGCAKFYCALSSVWKTSSHFPPFFTQTLALLYVPDMSLPSEVCCMVVLYLTTATSALGKEDFHVGQRIVAQIRLSHIRNFHV